MYINKTSRRIIFLNAAFLAFVVLWVATKVYGNRSLFDWPNFAYLFSTSVIVESLRPFRIRRRARKIFRNTRRGFYLVLGIKPSEKLQLEMEEIERTDRI